MPTTITLEDNEAARAIEVLRHDAELGDEPHRLLSALAAKKIAAGNRTAVVSFEAEAMATRMMETLAFAEKGLEKGAAHLKGCVEAIKILAVATERARQVFKELADGDDDDPAAKEATRLNDALANASNVMKLASASTQQ